MSLSSQGAPPPSTPGPLAPAAVAALLESTCALIEGEIGALSEDDARWHPAPGEWCVNEVLGHMIESEKRGFFGRITRTLEQGGQFEEPWDQIAVARERRDCERMASSLFMEWMGIRHRSVEMVKGLRPDQLGRTCRHGKVGELSVGDLLHEWVHHDRNHTRQLLANVQARAWPHMGNAQKFTGE
ncbi:MAG: DinB family protein [Chloroflexi bacterium]|nr:DinB family protein [Chloroflexota bacterium]